MTCVVGVKGDFYANTTKKNPKRQETTTLARETRQSALQVPRIGSSTWMDAWMDGWKHIPLTGRGSVSCTSANSSVGCRTKSGCDSQKLNRPKTGENLGGFGKQAQSQRSFPRGVKSKLSWTAAGGSLLLLLLLMLFVMVQSVRLFQHNNTEKYDSLFICSAQADPQIHKTLLN